MMAGNLNKKSFFATATVVLLMMCSGMYVAGTMSAHAQDALVDVVPDEAGAVATEATVPPVIEQPALPASATTQPLIPNQEGASDVVSDQKVTGSYENLEEDDFKVLDEAIRNIAALRTDVVKPADVGTVLFTLWQHSLLQEAKRLLSVRPVGAGEDLSGTGVGMGGAAGGEGAAVPRGIRELSLSGILFKGKDNWIVWLNGKRLAPDALPKEIMDIKVSEQYVDLKWFDAYTNLIYPVRIRPHQRFNLDSRIFLPGITGDSAAQLQASTQAQ